MGQGVDCAVFGVKGSARNEGNVNKIDLTSVIAGES